MVSVIIATYNYAAFIAETLDSVKSQTYPDWECIIIDDGSTDNTVEAVRPFLNDKRFSYTPQNNKGVSAARNSALKRARGEYILFLDADDLIERDKLKSAVDFLDSHKEVSLVYSDMRYFKTEDRNQLFMNYACDPANDKPWMSYASGQGAKILHEILHGNFMVISSPVFRADALKDSGWFDENIVHNEDWDLWMRMILANKRIQHHDAPHSKALVRIHKSSASLNVFKMQVCGLKVLQKNAGKIKSFNEAHTLEIRIHEHVAAIKASLLGSGNTEDFKSKILVLGRYKLYDDFFRFNMGQGLLARLYLKILNLIR